MPWVELRWLKLTADGLQPNADGLVEFRATNLTDLQDTYSDSNLTVLNTNPVVLDSDGRAPDPIYLLPTGYSVYVYDSDMVLLYSIPFVEDVGSAFLSQLGTIQTEGTTATSSPYTVLSTDNLVIVDSATTPFIVQLPAAADRGTPLMVKNISSGVTVRVTPDGSEDIDSVAAYVSLIAYTAPPAPTLVLLSNGVSSWWISSSI